MPDYDIYKKNKTKQCLRCGKVFSHNGNLTRHANTKKMCPATYIDVDRQDMITNYDKHYTKFMLSEENLKSLNIDKSSEESTDDLLDGKLKLVRKTKENKYKKKPKNHKEKTDSEIIKDILNAVHIMNRKMTTDNKSINLSESNK